jgi:hypothetical protein
MNRYKAAGIHFVSSAAVLLLIAAVVRWIWYPGPFFFVAGGINLIGIIAGVDVVLGPLIMLIIFNPAKKSIKFDVACVLVFQLAFLGYGAWSIVQARPVFIALVGERFHMVTANEIEDVSLNKAKFATFKTLPLTGPIVVGTQGPTDAKKAEDVLFAGTGGMGLQHLPEYYVPLEQVQEQIKRIAKPVGATNQLSKEDRKFLENYEATHKARSIGFVPLIYKQRRLFAVIDKENGALREVLLPQ